MKTRTVWHFGVFLLVALGVATAAAPALTAQITPSDLFSRSTMREVDLQGLHVWLGQPVQVTAQVGWEMSWPQHQDAHAFIHLTPFIAKFPNGNLIGIYTLDPDTQSNPVFASGFQISKDGGAHWGRRYSMLMQHISVLFVPRPNDALLALPSELFEATPGDDRNLQGPYYLFEHGGDRMVFVPNGVRIVDWPWPVAVYPGPQPRENWHAGVILTGNSLEVGGRLLATGYFQKKDAGTYSSVILASGDGGYTWRYLSTVADPDPALVVKRAYEGPNEMSMVQLANGDLMAVFRVGSGYQWHVRRAYSHDGGRTWSKPDVLPAWSVEPEVIRTANGTIALSTGRPGIRVWLSTDARATQWQSIDIVDYHNRCVSEPNERIESFARGPSPYVSDPAENLRWQTSSYTRMVEVAPNRLLLIYDRDPERPPADANDLSRVYVLPIELTRS